MQYPSFNCTEQSEHFGPITSQIARRKIKSMIAILIDDNLEWIDSVKVLDISFSEAAIQ